MGQVAKANRQKCSKVLKITHDVNSFAVNAIVKYLKSTDLRPSKSLEHLCQLFSVLFALRSSDLLSTGLITQILSLPARFILQMISYITVQIGHPDEKIKSLAHLLLSNSAMSDFQKIFFALNLYAMEG